MKISQSEYDRKMNDFNCTLVDQYCEGIINRNPEFFGTYDHNKKQALAFVILSIKTYLGIDENEAIDYVTDGAQDYGIDGIYVGSEDNGELPITLFQCKYKSDLSGSANFPANAVEKIINTVGLVFDPDAKLTVNAKLSPVLEDARSQVRDGLIPVVTVVLCNNGTLWGKDAAEMLSAAKLPPEQVRFTHFNHNSIVERLRKNEPITEDLRLSGMATVESFNFKRVLVGKVALSELNKLFEKYDMRLLERNIRNYLGLRTNRVNSAIADTILSNERRDDFYFFNNGVTITCDKFSHNALQSGDFTVHVQGMQIINGGQTCKTIAQVVEENPEILPKLQNSYVMIRIYEVPDAEEDFISAITYATNNQNPVDLRDLHANDPIQQKLGLGFKALGYEYRRKRGNRTIKNVITSKVAAEAVLAIWKLKPQQAKFMRAEHFGKLYNKIFSDIDAAKTLLAVEIFRFVESKRKVANDDVKYRFIPYASHYIAMWIGKKFLEQNNLEISGVSHKNIQPLLKSLKDALPSLYASALDKIAKVLGSFYKAPELSLQQLSATFRRGDIIDLVLSDK